jgi:hypothetical protein
MDKRTALKATLAGGTLWTSTSARPAPPVGTGPGLLTVCGEGVHGNRGPLDPVRDQMMVHHGVQFSAAYVFDAVALQRLPAQTIRPVLEYDGQRHTLRGPRLTAVLAAAGVRATSGWQLGLRAADGYRVELSLTEAVTMGMIVATQMDGQALALGGLGPQWAVYEPEAVAAWRERPLKERFARCPWGLYLIELRRA